MNVTPKTAMFAMKYMYVSRRKRKIDENAYTGPMTTGPAGTVRQTVRGTTYAGGFLAVVRKAYGTAAMLDMKDRITTFIGNGFTQKQAIEALIENVNTWNAVTLSFNK